MKLNLMNLINILNQEVVQNEPFDFLSVPRIIAYVTLGIAVICLLVILIRYLVKRKKREERNKTINLKYINDKNK